MKVRIMTTLLALALSGTIRAQSITLVAPNGGESWKLGASQNIVWTFTGIPNGTPVKLVLFRNNDKIGQIVENISIGAGGAGMYSWKVGNWEGGTAAAGGGYKLRIRDMNGAYPADDGNNPFTITLGMTAGLNEGVAELNPLHIIEPTSTSLWTIGAAEDIRWQASDKVQYPLSIFLVSAAQKMPVVDIGKVNVYPDIPKPMEAHWSVTNNVFDEPYCIRIISADSKYYAYSMPFRIKTTKTTSTGVLASQVANKVGWHYAHSEGYNTQVNDTGLKELADIPDPGGKTAKYGYQYWYKDNDNWQRNLHRSYVFFDLGEVIGKLKGKPTVKMVSIEGHTTANSPQVCNSRIWCLKAPMVVGNGNGMFGDAFDAFPKRMLGADPQARIQEVQRWLDDPSKNYGLVIMAENEGHFGETGQCVRFCTWVLQLEIEEKLNI